MVKKLPANAGTWVWKDPTCRGAAKPLHHNYQRPSAVEPVLRDKSSHRDKKPLRAETRENPSPEMRTSHSQKSDR